MAERSIRVFFYGLFMDADLLRAKGARPAAVTPASVAGWSLRIGRRATMVENAGGRVHGMLMDLTHAEIDALYAEPSVAMYRPEAVLCETADGQRLAALCFMLPEPPAPEERDAGYADKLRALAARLGLPQNYSPD